MPVHLWLTFLTRWLCGSFHWRDRVCFHTLLNLFLAMWLNLVKRMRQKWEYTGPKFRLQEDLHISVSLTRLACWCQKLGKMHIQAATLPAVWYAFYKHTSICLFIHLLADIWVRSSLTPILGPLLAMKNIPPITFCAQVFVWIFSKVSHLDFNYCFPSDLGHWAHFCVSIFWSVCINIW